MNENMKLLDRFVSLPQRLRRPLRRMSSRGQIWLLLALCVPPLPLIIFVENPPILAAFLLMLQAGFWWLMGYVNGREDYSPRPFILHQPIDPRFMAQPFNGPEGFKSTWDLPEDFNPMWNLWGIPDYITEYGVSRPQHCYNARTKEQVWKKWETAATRQK